MRIGGWFVVGALVTLVGCSEDSDGKGNGSPHSTGGGGFAGSAAGGSSGGGAAGSGTPGGSAGDGGSVIAGAGGASAGGMSGEGGDGGDDGGSGESGEGGSGGEPNGGVGGNSGAGANSGAGGVAGSGAGLGGGGASGGSTGAGSGGIVNGGSGGASAGRGGAAGGGGAAGAGAGAGGTGGVGGTTGNGPYVSSSTCVSTDQRGTIARPFCTIQAGVTNVAGATVHVARGTSAYLESVTLRDGVTVFGGYEPTFVASRDPNPSTNGTAVQSTGAAFTWSDGASAAVDGFSVVAAQPTTSQTRRGLFTVAGTAHAVIANVSTTVTTATARYTNDYGIYVSAGTGGSLELRDSSIQAFRANTSAALGTDALADVSIGVSNSTLLGGAGSVSAGVDLAGTGDFTMAGGAIRAASATSTNVGLRAVATANPARRSIELLGVAVEGNRGGFAYGIQVTGGAELTVQGGSVNGKGPDRGDTVTSMGIFADSVVTVTVSGATITGSDVTPSNFPTLQAYALNLANTASVAGASAHIANSTLQGGTAARLRRGLVSQGVPFVLETSTVSGSLATGALNPVGVELTGTFPNGASAWIRDNVRIVGGDAVAPCNDYRCGSAGILVNTGVNSVIENNQLIQGSNVASGFSSEGIRINQGGTHAIEDNDLIAGGDENSVNQSFVGIRVLSVGSTIATLTVDGNALIAGVPSSDMHAISAVGFSAEGVDATITNNRLLGGWGGFSAGLAVGRSRETSGAYSNVENHLIVRDNVLDGGAGSSTAATFTWQTNSVITNNLVRACGLELPDGSPDPQCLQRGTSVGLEVKGDKGSLVANNYVFGGFTSTSFACKVGCYRGECLAPLSTTFANNLCAVVSTNYSATTITATALELGMPPAADCPLVANNVLDASGTAGTVRAFSHFDTSANSTPTECFRFFNNELVPRGLTCPAVVYGPPSLCFANATALNARGNATQQIAANVELAPNFVAPNIQRPTAAGYHLDSSCTLRGLGTAVSGVSADWDAQTRGNPPEIGPDECP